MAERAFFYVFNGKTILFRFLMAFIVKKNNKISIRANKLNVFQLRLQCDCIITMEIRMQAIVQEAIIKQAQ